MPLPVSHTSPDALLTLQGSLSPADAAEAVTRMNAATIALGRLEIARMRDPPISLFGSYRKSLNVLLSWEQVILPESSIIGWPSRFSVPLPIFPGCRNAGLDCAFVAEYGRFMMASNGHFFLAGFGTTLLTIACAFGGSVMLARTGSEPSTRQMAAAALPSVRVILPALAEPAQPGREPVQPTAIPQTSGGLIAITEGPEAAEEHKQGRLTELRTGTAERRHRLQKMAERKAKREATRLASEQQRRPQATILASGLDDDQRSQSGGFFGNN
jgi:hypothetical protein